MKILDRAMILIFNVCLLLVAVWISAIPIAKNPSYYHFQFKVNGIYQSVDEEGNAIQKPIRYLGGEYSKYAKYSDEQLNVIIEHIIDFLFNDKEEFGLEMENVYVSNSKNGEYKLVDKVQVFGDVAISHMNDVKQVFIIYQIISVIAFVMLIGIGAYLLLRIGQVRKILFEYTMLFYGIFISICSIFLMINFIYAIKEWNDNSYYLNFADQYIDTFWRNIHWLFFLFQPDKVNGSFFNDTLTMILTTDLFITAVVLVVLAIILLQVLWLGYTLVMKVFGGRLAYKIKQYKYANSIVDRKKDTTSNN